MTDKLHSAIRWGKTNDVKDLIASDPGSVNAQDAANGNYALHIAAQNGHMDLVKMLVDGGAKVNSQNGGGQTALHMVVTYNTTEIIDYLNSKGADGEIKNGEGFPAKYGLGGERDPSGKPYKIAMLKESTTEGQLIAALNGIKGSGMDKAEFVQAGLITKRLCKAFWTPAVQSVFAETLESL